MLCALKEKMRVENPLARYASAMDHLPHRPVLRDVSSITSGDGC